MIVRLSPPYLRTVSEAHVRLDPTAFLSDIEEYGIAFREKIYYPALLKESNAFVWVALVQGVLAGYIAGTCDAEAFQKALGKYRPGALLSLLARASLRKPGFILRCLRTAKGLKAWEEGYPIPAEVLSFGVLPQYRTAEFEKASGRYVAEELYQRALQSFREMGVRQFKVMTIQKNTTANRFYEKQGLRRSGETRPFGSVCNVFVGSPNES